MLTALITSMRPKQWVKNGFLLFALIFDGKLVEASAVRTVLFGVVVFSMLASSVYLINDLSDLESDRQHPRKKLRPIAAGQLPIWTAWAAVLLLLLIGLPAALLLDPFFFWLCLFYLATNLAYTHFLKHIAILDVILLAGFYVIRVGAGVSLVDVQRFSPWLYVFTTFLALFLGIGKRRAELFLMQQDAGNTRRVLEGYTLAFLDTLTIIVSGMAIMTYSLYTFSAPNLPENHSMMLTIPFVIYGIFRYLYLVQVENSGEAPTEVLYTDRPLQVCVVMWAISVLTILYVF
ncbi:MAG TPA: decaprenyl-phosphate phosphoribosyltransferase [Anaerolineales bacterium]|nr:decaprenyl-phosphate phosphoribosyltransferase [Anaerolineales bacterium]